MYKPDDFKLYELIPRNIYKIYNGSEKLWYLFDNRILVMAQSLRDRYGKMSANTWYWDGAHQYRGWRPFSLSIGAKLSQHKFGRAIDLVPTEVSVDEIRNDIKENYMNDDFRFITCIEDNTSWLHTDCRNHNKYKDGLLIVKP